MGQKSLKLALIFHAVFILLLSCDGKKSVMKDDSSAIKAKGPAITFEKTYGNRDKTVGLSMDRTVDGGYILFGWTKSFDDKGDAGDMYLVKTDKLGNVLWEKVFGGDDWEDGYSVKQAADGGYILFGTTRSFGAGGDDFYLVKTDQDGNEFWSRTFGGEDKENARDVCLASDGGYIMIGYTKSFGAGMADMYVVKTDKDGNEKWSATFGGPGNDWGRSVFEASDGNILLLGQTPGVHGDVFLIKADPTGKKIWEKTYGGAGKDKGKAVIESSDGGYVILADSVSYMKRDSDIYIIMTDRDGNELRSAKIGGGHDEWGYSIKKTHDEGYIILGSSKSFSEGGSDFYLVKVVMDGDDIYKVFDKVFGGEKSDIGWSVAQADDLGYALLGWTASFGNENGEMYLIKTDEYGEVKVH